MFLCVILPGLLPLMLKSQDAAGQLQHVNEFLPTSALKSKFRVQVMESSPDQMEALQKVAKDFTSRYRQNTYIVRRNGLIRLHAGDFQEKKFAKMKQAYLKRNFKKIRIVTADNDSVIGSFLVEKKKPVKKVMPPPPPEKHDIRKPVSNPPSKKYILWDDPKYNMASSAWHEDYLTPLEQKVGYYLNLARMNPNLS